MKGGTNKMVAVYTYIIIGLIAFIFMLGIRIVRPIHVMLVETLGKFTRTKESGFTWIIPLIQSGRFVNITEQMVDIAEQTVITKDKLNATIDAIVYYKIIDPKKSQYNVENHEEQLTALASTTLRAVVGKMSLTEANE